MEVLFIDTLAVTLGNEMGFLFALKQVPVIIKKKPTFFIVRYCLSSTPFMSFFLLLILRSLIAICGVMCCVYLSFVFIYIIYVLYIPPPYTSMTHSAIHYIYILLSIYLSVSCSLLFMDLYSLFIFYVNHLFPNFYCTAYSL